MKNIKILKTGIDVSKIRKQLEKYPEDWGSQQKLKNVKLKDPHEYITSVDVLQLVMGGITNPGEEVGNTEICTKTPAYKKHSEIRKFLNKNYPNYCRCGFLALPVGEIVGAHIDEGTYYLSKDRYHIYLQHFSIYHLSLQVPRDHNIYQGLYHHNKVELELLCSLYLNVIYESLL